MPSGARSSVVPTLERQRILPAFRSTATISPHGGLLHGQAQRRQRDRTRHRERRPLLPSEIVTGRRVEPIGHGSARKQLDDVDRPRGVGIKDLVDGIERSAAPVHAAPGHRKHHGALRRWRRVEAFVARRCNLLAADPAIPERNHAEHVVGRNPLRHQRRHMGRKRLRRRQLLALGAALRHRAFFHRPYWLAGVAIEHEHKALLGRLDHHIALALAGIDARQRRLRRQVVIPDIVMHGLIRPHKLAGFGAKCDHRIGVLVVAGPLAAPEVRARRGRRQKYQAARFVHRHRRPDIGVTGDDAIMHQRIETPARQPRPRIEGAHRAGRRLDAAIIGNRGADNDDAADDHRGRRDLEFAGPFQRPPVSNLTSPLVPKSAQGMPVFASSAITRTSLVPMKIRARQAAVSAAPSSTQ